MAQQHKPERLDMDAINEQAIVEDRKKAKAEQIGAGLAVTLFLVVMIPASLGYGWDILVSWWSVGWMAVCLIAYWIFSRIVHFVLPDRFGCAPIQRQDFESNRWYDNLDWGLIIGGGSVVLVIVGYLVGYGIWSSFESREESKYQDVKRAPLSTIIKSYYSNATRADESFKDGLITTVRVRGISSGGILEISAGGY